MSTVTAIISTFNSQRFFANRLENLLTQTILDRLEVVVVDSGSTENESEIALAYKQAGAPIKLIRTQKETLYASWNRAIEIATGDYLLSANTDDRLVPEACAVMVEALDSNPEIALVYSDAWETSVEEEVIACSLLSYRPGRRRVFRRPYSHTALLLECCCGPFPMWRRSIHAQVGSFDAAFSIAGDWEFWLRIAEVSPLLHLNQPLGLIARRDDSLLWHNQELWIKENALVRSKYFGNSAPKSPAKTLTPSAQKK